MPSRLQEPRSVSEPPLPFPWPSPPSSHGEAPTAGGSTPVRGGAAASPSGGSAVNASYSAASPAGGSTSGSGHAEASPAGGPAPSDGQAAALLAGAPVTGDGHAATLLAGDTSPGNSAPGVGQATASPAGGPAPGYVLAQALLAGAPVATNSHAEALPAAANNHAEALPAAAPAPGHGHAEVPAANPATLVIPDLSWIIRNIVLIRRVVMLKPELETRAMWEIIRMMNGFIAEDGGLQPPMEVEYMRVARLNTAYSLTKRFARVSHSFEAVVSLMDLWRVDLRAAQYRLFREKCFWDLHPKQEYHIMEAMAVELHQECGGALSITNNVEPARRPRILDLCSAPGAMLSIAMRLNPDADAVAFTLAPDQLGTPMVLGAKKNLRVWRTDVNALFEELFFMEPNADDDDSDDGDSVMTDRDLYSRAAQRYPLVQSNGWLEYTGLGEHPLDDLSKGFDLVICDGGLPHPAYVQEKEAPQLARSVMKDERENLRLQCSQIGTGLSSIREGGTMIVKLHDVHTYDNMALTCRFKTFSRSVTLFKSQRAFAHDSSYYLVARGITRDPSRLFGYEHRRCNVMYRKATWGSDEVYARARRFELENTEVLQERYFFGYALLAMPVLSRWAESLTNDMFDFGVDILGGSGFLVTQHGLIRIEDGHVVSEEEILAEARHLHSTEEHVQASRRRYCQARRALIAQQQVLMAQAQARAQARAQAEARAKARAEAKARVAAQQLLLMAQGQEAQAQDAGGDEVVTDVEEEHDEGGEQMAGGSGGAQQMAGVGGQQVAVDGEQQLAGDAGGEFPINWYMQVLVEAFHEGPGDASRGLDFAVLPWQLLWGPPYDE